MRFGKWRGVPLAAALAAVLGLGLTSTVQRRWRLFHSTTHCLGRCRPTILATGGEYLAPPVPYGHYAKDPAGEVHKGRGHAAGTVARLSVWFTEAGVLVRCRSGIGLGNGCGACGGAVREWWLWLFALGRGLFHHGNGGRCGSTIAMDGCGGASLHGHGLDTRRTSPPVTRPRSCPRARSNQSVLPVRASGSV